LFEFLGQILSVEVDDQEGLVSIGVEFSDRKIAAQLAQAATDLLQTKIIAFKSQSARNNCSLSKVNLTQNARSLNKFKTLLRCLKIKT
jgi:hypothetical protein